MKIEALFISLFCVWVGYMYIKQSNKKKLGAKTKIVALIFGKKFALIYKKIFGYIILITGIFFVILSFIY